MDPTIVDHTEEMGERKRIALVAHDYRKNDLIDWAKQHKKTLMHHELFGTGTTGGRLQNEAGLKIHRFMSGPVGGDLQIGAAIAENKIDLLIFFWDPLQAQPHDVDVKALLRIAVVYNIPVACSRSTADFLISSELFNNRYQRYIVDYNNRFSQTEPDG
jgi:methylglyoxal synthase